MTSAACRTGAHGTRADSSTSSAASTLGKPSSHSPERPAERAPVLAPPFRWSRSAGRSASSGRSITVERARPELGPAADLEGAGSGRRSCGPPCLGRGLPCSSPPLSTDPIGHAVRRPRAPRASTRRDARPCPVRALPPERAQDGGGGVRRGEHVGGLEVRGPRARLVALLEVHEPGDGVGDGAKRRPKPPGPGLAEAGDGAVHDVGLDRADRVVVARRACATTPGVKFSMKTSAWRRDVEHHAGALGCERSTAHAFLARVRPARSRCSGRRGPARAGAGRCASRRRRRGARS